MQSLVNGGIPAWQIPAKIEGVTFGPDVWVTDHQRVHTLWIANDNDFLQMVLDPNGNQILNPNQFFVFSFTDSDLPDFVPQQFREDFRW